MLKILCIQQLLKIVKIQLVKLISVQNTLIKLTNCYTISYIKNKTTQDGN